MVTRSLFLAIGLGMGVLAALGCERVDGSSLTTDPIVNDSAGSSPSLSVQGPDVINTKGTFQYTASPLHFGGTPSVLWSERFCNDTTGKGCSAWTGDSGPAATYDRVLGPDCSTPARNYQVRATARWGTQVVVTSRTSFLCGPV